MWGKAKGYIEHLKLNEDVEKYIVAICDLAYVEGERNAIARELEDI